MYAVTTALDGPGAVTVVELADPEPGPGEVLVEVEAASINPADIGLVSGGFPAKVTDAAAHPIVPGWDLAGTVTAVGVGVDAALVGRRVLGFNHWFVSRSGTQASRVTLPAEQVAPASDMVPAAELTSLGLNGMTAIQLVAQTGLSAGQTLLVTGAAGSVGALAVQLAVRQGLVVVGYARESDRESVLGLGAGLFVSRDDDLRAAVEALVPGGVDAVANTVPGQGVGIEAVRDGGTYRSISATPDEERGIDVARVGVKADAADLAELVHLRESGGLQVQVGGTSAARTESRQAYALATTAGRRGPVVLLF